MGDINNIISNVASFKSYEIFTLIPDEQVIYGNQIIPPVKGTFSKKDKTPGISYILTNKRALIIAIFNEETRLIKSCSIYETIPNLKNFKIQNLEQTDDQGHKFVLQVEMGDIAFIKDGKILLEFDNIISPKDMLDSINKIIKSSFG